MRSSGTVSMISALEWNLNHGQRNLRLFEIGKTYELKEGQPAETAVLTLGATGLAREKSIYESARQFEFADLKGDLDSIAQLAAGFRWLSGSPGWLAGAVAATISLERCGNSSSASATLGIAGQLARRVADQLKLRQDIFVAELWLEPLLGGIEAARATLKFTPIPRFPAVERDFSLTLSDGTSFAQVAETIRSLNIPELQSIKPADLFRGGQVPAGKFSLMVRVAFQSTETTLTDAQIAEYSSRIVAALEKNLGATLRAS
jgi:phenylalanyl-tRNA synthetase beta chain